MKAEKQHKTQEEKAIKSGFDVMYLTAKINGTLYRFVEGVGVYNILGDKVA